MANNSTFNLNEVLYQFNGNEPFTIRDACEGVQIFGGIGSGKTSGSGAALAKSYLRAGFGGLVLCAKKDEMDTWLEYAEQTGRERSVIVFDTSGKFVFPFLQYEIEREGEGAGYTENLVRLFTTVYESISRQQTAGGANAYWTRAMQQLLRNAIDLSLIVKGTTSISLIQQIIFSAPLKAEERDSQEWRDNSLCWQLMAEGNAKELDVWAAHDFESTVAFWLKEYPHLATETRSGILSNLTTMMDIFLRRPFRQLFSEPPPDRRQILRPEFTHKGAIIIMNLPVKEYGDAGRAAQVVYKYLWQQATERRSTKENPRPVFLWVDEAQNFATEYDMQFQATARSSRACTVYLTQNLPNYYAEMGGEHSKPRVDSLVGNLQTKIWHANSDPSTNTHAADTIGKSWQKHKSSGKSFGESSVNISKNENESFDFDVSPQEFTKLAKGGTAENGYHVEGIVFQNGRIWKNKKTHLFTKFNQKES